MYYLVPMPEEGKRKEKFMKLRKVSAVLMSMSMVGAMAVPTFADEAKTIEPCEITFWHAMNGKQFLLISSMRRMSTASLLHL